MTSPEFVKNSKIFGLVFALCFFIPVTGLTILALNTDSSEDGGAPSVGNANTDHSAPPAFVTLKNDTVYPIAKLVFSGNGVSTEIQTPLDPQQVGEFSFDTPSSKSLPCTLDATVVYRDGEEASIGSFDFCSNSSSTLLIRDQSDSKFE